MLKRVSIILIRLLEMHWLTHEGAESSFFQHCRPRLAPISWVTNEFHACLINSHPWSQPHVNMSSASKFLTVSQGTKFGKLNWGGSPQKCLRLKSLWSHWTWTWLKLARSQSHLQTRSLGISNDFKRLISREIMEISEKHKKSMTRYVVKLQG